MIATFVSPPEAASAASTSSPGAPVASRTMLRTRSRSLSFAGTTPTIRPSYVLPRRIMDTVEIVLRTSFCAVPAFSRVEPARISGPTTTSISCAHRRARSDPGTHTTQAVNEPAADAARAAPSAKGVLPLALTTITASSGPGRSASSARAPAPSSSSAASRSSVEPAPRRPRPRRPGR